MEMTTRNWELNNKEGEEERQSPLSEKQLLFPFWDHASQEQLASRTLTRIDGQPEDAENVYQSAGSLVSKCHQPTDINAQQPEGSCIAVISRALWMSTSDPSWRYFALMLDVSNSTACRPLASAVTAARLGVYGLTYGETLVMPRCQSSHYRLPRCNSGTPAALSMGELRRLNVGL